MHGGGGKKPDSGGGSGGHSGVKKFFLFVLVAGEIDVCCVACRVFAGSSRGCICSVCGAHKHTWPAAPLTATVAPCFNPAGILVVVAGVVWAHCLGDAAKDRVMDVMAPVLAGCALLCTVQLWCFCSGLSAWAMQRTG